MILMEFLSNYPVTIDSHPDREMVKDKDIGPDLGMGIPPLRHTDGTKP